MESRPHDALFKYLPPPLLLHSKPRFHLPETPPNEFYGKHLSETQLLKRVLPLSSLPEILFRFTDEEIKSALTVAQSRKNGGPIRPGIFLKPLTSLQDLADYYDDVYLHPVSRLASTLLLQPSLDEWRSTMIFPSEVVNDAAFETTAYHWRVSFDPRAPGSESEASQLEAMCYHTPVVLVWQMFAPLPDAVSLLQNIPLTTTFQWQYPSVSTSHTSTYGFQSVDSTTMPWEDALSQIDVRPYQGRVLRSANSTKTQTSSSLALPKLRKRQTTPVVDQQNPEAYLQKLWFKAVENDATLVVMYCGSHQRIGIRHRETQTLYLSDVIAIENNEGFAKLQLGLHMAAIQDAKGRLDELKSLPRFEIGRGRGRKRLRPKDDDGSREDSKRSRRSIPVCQKDLASTISTTDHVLLRLEVDLLDSPIPSFFTKLRYPFDIDSASPRKRIYPLKASLSLLATCKVGSGATGDIYAAQVSLGEEIHPKDVILKLAFSPDSKKRLLNEGRIYDHLHKNGCTHILNFFGIYTSIDNDCLLLILEDGGHVVTEVDSITQPGEAHGCFVVSPDKRVKFLDALASLHRADVVHRDLRLYNFLVDDDENVRIIDFDRSRIGKPERHKSGEVEGLITVLTGQVSSVLRGGSEASTISEESLIEPGDVLNLSVPHQFSDSDGESVEGIASLIFGLPKRAR